MPKILIAGYHGFGNCGDEAILLAMKNNIEALYGNDGSTPLTVLSFRPQETDQLYGIKSVNRFKALDVLRAIADADVLISGGGSLLQDETSFRSLLYYLALIFWAKLLGKKAMLYSNGIGPVSKRLSRLLIRLVVNKVDLITLREGGSADELKRLGVTRPPVYITADPAFTLTGSPREKSFKILEAEGIPHDKPIVGVSLRPWKGCEAFFETFAMLCDYIIEKYGVNVLLIPMQRTADVSASDAMADKMKNPAYVLRGKYGIDDVLGIIGTVDIMLGMRLHALIFAGVQNVPMLGFVYDPKVESFLKLLDMPRIDNIQSLCIDDAINAADDLFANSEAYRLALRAKTAELSEKARQNDELLKELF